MNRKYMRPTAITMWDFSWLERRWPGAGYEDWDLALDELAERGYDSIRIDAYPHLVAADPNRRWKLLPGWNQTSWGAQSVIETTILPQLIEFVEKAKQRNMTIALSSWYRQDVDNHRLKIDTPEKQAQIWIDTLGHIEKAGLLDAILFVDLCNEFPGRAWAPYVYKDATTDPTASRVEPYISQWINTSLQNVRSAYPQLDFTYSFSNEYDNWPDQDVSEFDLLEPHVWMSHPETSDYQEKIGYHFERFEPIGFDNIVANGHKEYFAQQERYDNALLKKIDQVAAWSRASKLGVVTTECWALVDYKDWPGLDWGWIKDLTEFGLQHAANSGRWIGMATSNFCGPQFVGMWRDIEWHQRLTTMIKKSSIDPDIFQKTENKTMQETS